MPKTDATTRRVSPEVAAASGSDHCVDNRITAVEAIIEDYRTDATDRSFAGLHIATLKLVRASSLGTSEDVARNFGTLPS